MNVRSLTVGLAAAAILATAASPAQAQVRSGFSWGTAIPFSDTKDYTDAASFRNFGLEASVMRGANAVGLYIGWSVFDDVIDVTQSVGDNPVDINGRQYRTTNVLPILVTGRKHLGRLNDPHLFVGAGVGTVFTRRRLDVGILNVDDDAWHFAFVPEVGFEAPLSPSAAVFLSAKYHLMTESDGVGEQFLGFSIGVTTR